jgi:hypothetical protein
MLHDPTTNLITYTKETTLTLEHSLVSLSKWESKWKVPFLNQEHSPQMFDDYIRCMTITQNVDPNVYLTITPEIREQIRNYIDDSLTAAIVHENKTQPKSSKFVTSDLIYYWMTALNIPFDPCQKWHLSRLLMLIKIANIENKPSKDRKMSKADSARSHHAINAARRAKRRR